MSLSFPDAHAAGFALYKLDRELSSYSTLNIDPASLDDYILLCQAGGTDFVEQQIIHSFGLANEIVNNSRYTDVTAHSPLARAAIAASRRGDILMDRCEQVSERGCLEAELRLMRSLDYVTGISGQSPDTKHRPAAIVFDINDEPCAYEKSSGLKTAFAWRNAIIVTQAGERFIPGSGWFALQGDEEALFRAQRYQGKGVVSLESVSPPVDAHFLRFGTNLLAPSIARLGHIAATEHNSGNNVGKLRQNLDAALSLDPEKLADRIYSLLHSGQVVRAKDR